jgi:hypothetical protein
MRTKRRNKKKTQRGNTHPYATKMGEERQRTLKWKEKIEGKVREARGRREGRVGSQAGAATQKSKKKKKTTKRGDRKQHVLQLNVVGDW